MSNRNELLLKVLELDSGDRKQLALQIFDTLEPEAPLTQDEWDRAWGAEIEERLRRFDAGETEAIPVEDAMNQLRRSLRESRAR